MLLVCPFSLLEALRHHEVFLLERTRLGTTTTTTSWMLGTLFLKQILRALLEVEESNNNFFI
jgi:hypothetical protein